MKELEKNYNPSEIEEKIYEKWLNGGYFKPEIHKDGKPYTIIMPPPNITGQLHIGHAFDFTLQDILIRYHRMQGYSALWLPGEDHASIATEVKVVDKIFKEEGKTKQDLGREEFLKRAWDWSDFYRNRIAMQCRKLGGSCDWDRERFTLDEGLNEAVKEAFIRMYNKGLIYRANRIINWCPDCMTALSDAEVEYEEQDSFLWYIKYPIKNEENKFIVVATTRPETMLGDTAVAVNPHDERYMSLIGKTAILPLINREIPIIADDVIDMQFGTGCVKITPCHDPNDFETGLRHDLQQIRVFNYDATMNEYCGKYEGMTTTDARAAIVKDLSDLGLMEKIEQHAHNVGTCYRCHTTVEPITSLQWFVKMKPLAEPAIEAVKKGESSFVPDRFKKIYFSWMENIRDWCISRQLWWGHRIPVYYCDNCAEIIASKDTPDKCPKCGSSHFTQDEDVLDTWFSSALWPFSTMGWPNETPDLKKFYPNDVLVTGFDIIFFWVARMVFSGIEQMGKPPFHHIYIHGLVRDSLGRKMSKSLGNGVDPLDIIDKFGADALRYALVTGNAAGNDTRWQEEKIQSARNFTNKINNAARFIMMNLSDYDTDTLCPKNDLNNLDKWIISRTNEMKAEVTANLDKYELGIALEKLYNFIWGEFCDWYIEFSKPRLSGEDKNAKVAAQWTLYNVFNDILKLLHPFMPFISEEIYSCMNENEDMLIIAAWPKYNPDDNYADEQKNVSEIIDAIRGIRNARTKMNIPPSKKAKLYIVANAQNESIYKGNEDVFIKLASASEVILADKFESDNTLRISTNTANFIIPMDELVDKSKEAERLNKEKEKLLAEIERLNSKLENEEFIKKAPANVVENEREKLNKNQLLLKEIDVSIQAL